MGILNPTFKFAAHFRVRRSAHTLPFGALCMVRTPCLLWGEICSASSLPIASGLMLVFAKFENKYAVYKTRVGQRTCAECTQHHNEAISIPLLANVHITIVPILHVNYGRPF